MKGWLAAALALAACSEPDAPEPDPPVCGEGTSRSALSAVDRNIIGEAAPYVADGTLRARDDELRTSQRARREIAWQAVAKVLTEVPLAEPLPSLPGGPDHVPAWQTWYHFDDLRRVFHRLYADLSLEEKEARTRLSDADLDDAFLWNVGAVHELPTWPMERYLEYLAAVDDAGKVSGLGGISRVGYSPSAARHLLASYPEILACRFGEVPPSDATGPIEEVEVARAAAVAEPCGAANVGSYAIERDETLVAVLEEGEGAALTLRGAGETCTAGPGIACEIEGPATVDITVEAGAGAVSSVVAVTRRSDRPTWAGCLNGQFPADAAFIKADYRRADFEMKLPVFSTSAASLAQRLAGNVSWEVADGEADPGPGEVFSLTLPNGDHYRLAGLHIMTKELDHWLWITLWWSSSPDEDFGADRPPAVAALGAPWTSYKMCVVTAFDEGDPSADGGFGATHPSLAEALATVYAGEGSPSWCSNPYIEEGHGNAGSNCIGCHQHGGTTLESDAILGLPQHGRTELRNNFPTDYSWTVTKGDLLGQLFADEEAYYLGPQ
jgi:hypothetical protein